MAAAKYGNGHASSRAEFRDQRATSTVHKIVVNAIKTNRCNGGVCDADIANLQTLRDALRESLRTFDRV